MGCLRVGALSIPFAPAAGAVRHRERGGVGKNIPKKIQLVVLIQALFKSSQALKCY